MNVWTFYLTTSLIAVFINSLYCMYLNTPNEVTHKSSTSLCLISMYMYANFVLSYYYHIECMHCAEKDVTDLYCFMRK